MIKYTWDSKKNALLKETRRVSFEQVVLHIERGDLLKIIEHPNQEKYPGQRMLVLNICEYIYLVPFLDLENERVLKTIIPSRKATKVYLGET